MKTPPRPLARFDNGNSYTAVGQMTLAGWSFPDAGSSRCATHRSRTFVHSPSTRPAIRHSRALAQRRVAPNVAYVPRPDWREAEISMIRVGRLSRTSSYCSFSFACLGAGCICILISRFDGPLETVFVAGFPNIQTPVSPNPSGPTAQESDVGPTDGACI